VSRVEVVFLVGLVLAIAGALLFGFAGALATTWQPEGAGAVGGTTDPDLRLTYRLGGAVLAIGGLAALGIATRRWLSHAPGRARHGVG
jgi:hypothetical protein